jgi:transcriptional regulator with XRE-family HTH domain
MVSRDSHPSRLTWQHTLGHPDRRAADNLTPDLETSLGWRLKTAREEAGWDLEEACEWINIPRLVTPERLRSFEGNRLLPTSGLLTRIAAAYQVRLGWLIFGDGPMKNSSLRRFKVKGSGRDAD